MTATETFKPGDIYWIKGTYSLASHDRATLAAYTTAKNAADGRSKSYRAQTTIVKKGIGTFTLFLPIACEGWPHISFYPAEGGEGFGGNYFGTGESVLKRWWGEQNADTSKKEEESTKQTQVSRAAWRAFGRVTGIDGKPMAGVEVLAHCGIGTLRNSGRAISGADGRYELEFGTGIGSEPANGPFMQAAMISGRIAGYFEESLNRQGNCNAADAMPDEAQFNEWGITKARLFLPDRPLEINFVMRPAASTAGQLVDEHGQRIVKRSFAWPRREDSLRLAPTQTDQPACLRADFRGPTKGSAGLPGRSMHTRVTIINRKLAQELEPMLRTEAGSAIWRSIPITGRRARRWMT